MRQSVRIRNIDSYDLPLIEAAVEDYLGSCKFTRLTKSKRVLIKPNALGAFTPDRAVTTHPVVVEALIRYFLKQGKEVWVGDSPGGTVGFEQVFKTCGYTALAEKYPIKLVNISTSGFRELTYNGITVKVSNLLWQCGAVINVGKYKTHSLMAYTGALKNLYGLVPGMIKTEYHKDNPETGSFAELLVALYAVVRNRITYSFIDGIVGMDGAGPSAGNPRKFGLFFGSSSIPALDYIASKIMGFGINDVPYLSPALHLDGILPSKISIPTSFRGFRIEDADIRTVKISKSMLFWIPGFAKQAFRKVYDHRPVVGPDCKRCGVCVKSCPVKAINYDDAGLPVIDPKVCIKCMCCHELCPHHAIVISKPMISRLIGRFS
ncbi:MAG TPA: DUF362 domain-containing protein [Candidatus Cloacimonadota bacterium]|nr:DUF362 domain-containing protein [Candidatus Cloacimonadota bacterium]HPS38113.1 DUF362 domain-containing protein [Candidatus Cloacimonadota bacterium]